MDKRDMDKSAYVDADPAVVKATATLRSLRSVVNSRWGESRRFAGRMAGNRLDRIDRAQAAWGRAYDRAEVRFEKINKQLAAP